MAMFGFVYAWYLMAVLLLEIWFEYRRDLIVLGQQEQSPLRWVHRALSLFSKDVSPEALAFDRKAIRAITIIGIPSAFLLHGYVGFIFGSVKANPWWGSVLMPIVFLMSAIVSGIAMRASTPWPPTSSTPSSWTSRWRRSTSSTASTRARSR
jgi:formate-dependent nitrite reductase membrane component NrfD